MPAITPRPDGGITLTAAVDPHLGPAILYEKDPQGRITASLPDDHSILREWLYWDNPRWVAALQRTWQREDELPEDDTTTELPLPWHAAPLLPPGPPRAPQQLRHTDARQHPAPPHRDTPGPADLPATPTAGRRLPRPRGDAGFPGRGRAARTELHHGRHGSPWPTRPPPPERRRKLLSWAHANWHHTREYNGQWAHAASQNLRNYLDGGLSARYSRADDPSDAEATRLDRAHSMAGPTSRVPRRPDVLHATARTNRLIKEEMLDQEATAIVLALTKRRSLLQTDEITSRGSGPELYNRVLGAKAALPPAAPVSTGAGTLLPRELHPPREPADPPRARSSAGSGPPSASHPPGGAACTAH